MIVRTPGIQIVVQFVWPIRAGGDSLTPELIERIGPYLTRYAQTLNVLVHAVGGVDDHLHLLVDMPPTMSLQAVHDELQKPTARFLKDVLNRTRFAWAPEGWYACSISPEDVEAASEYVRAQAERHASGDLIHYLEGNDDEEPDDEEPPDWLREVLRPE